MESNHVGESVMYVVFVICDENYWWKMKSDCRLFVIINLCIVFVTVFRKIQIKKKHFRRRSCRFIGETFGDTEGTFGYCGYCIAASLQKTGFWTNRFIARKICLLRQKSRFIAQNWSNFIAWSVQENFCLVFSIASSVTKILANKIVSLYSIFFSKIVYLYRFKRYIF